MNWEIPEVKAGFRKVRGTRDQIAQIHWIVEIAREFQKKKKIYFSFIGYAKAFDSVSQQTMENSYRDENTRSPYPDSEKPVCGSRTNC